MSMIPDRKPNNFRLTYLQVETRRSVQSEQMLPSNQLGHEELRRALYENIGVRSHVEDLSYALRKYDAFTEKDLARAAYVATTDRFQQWLTVEYLDMLLIDGHCGEQIVERFSPMSIFCTTLIRSISDLPPNSGPRTRMVFYFFCGPHSFQYGNQNGPSALMSSIIIQLLMQWPQQSQPDLQFIETLPRGGFDIMALCQIFSSLLDQLSHNVSLYCIIDSISDFETILGGWAREMSIVMDYFGGITMRFNGPHRHQEAASVKFLLASAERSDRIRHYCAWDQVIDLRAGHMYGPELSPGLLTEALQGQVSHPWESSEVDSPSQPLEYSSTSSGSLSGRLL